MLVCLDKPYGSAFFNPPHETGIEGGTKRTDRLKKTFDPARIEAIFTLVASIKDNIISGSLNAAMANLVKAIQFYLVTPVLKKEREVLEDDFYDLLIRISSHSKFAGTYGPVSFRKGQHKDNIDFLEQLIKFGAESLKEKIDQGLELLDADRVEECRALFREVLNNPDVDINHFMAMGDGYLKKKLWKDAQDVFQQALEKDPESLHLLNRMAISLRKDRQFEAALAIYRKAVVLSPRDEGLFYNVARLFLDMGKPKSAGQALRKALAINPKFQPAARLLVGVQEAEAGLGRTTDKKN
jgi:tetratricopeptide (TPR) repeat protein